MEEDNTLEKAIEDLKKAKESLFNHLRRENKNSGDRTHRQRHIKASILK